MSASRKKPWVVVLGGGVAGLSCMSELCNYLTKNPDAFQVLVVDRSYSLLFKMANQFALAGRVKPHLIQKPYSELKLESFFVIQDEVLSINRQTKQVYCKGHKIRYDRLVIALGPSINPEPIPGIVQAAYDLNSITSATQVTDAVTDFLGGNVVVCISEAINNSYTLAYEYAFLLRFLINKIHSKEPKILGKTKVILTTPDSKAVPFLKSDLMEKYMKEKEIEFLPSHKPLLVNGKDKSIYFTNGFKLKYDILVSDLPVKAQAALVESKLANGAHGFVPSDPFTCKTEEPYLYCIGPSAEMILPNGTNIPRVETLYVQQGVTVARDIVKSFENENRAWNTSTGEIQSEPVPVYVEVGGNEAVKFTFNFYSKGVKESCIATEPNTENLDAFIAWWDDLVRKWFGDGGEAPVNAN